MAYDKSSPGTTPGAPGWLPRPEGGEVGRSSGRPCSVLLPDLLTMNPASDVGPAAFTDVTIPSDTTEARRVQEEIEAQLAARQFTEKEIFSVRLAWRRRWSTPSNTATRWT